MPRAMYSASVLLFVTCCSKWLDNWHTLLHTLSMIDSLLGCLFLSQTLLQGWHWQSIWCLYLCLPSKLALVLLFSLGIKWFSSLLFHAPSLGFHKTVCSYELHTECLVLLSLGKKPSAGVPCICSSLSFICLSKCCMNPGWDIWIDFLSQSIWIPR